MKDVRLFGTSLLIQKQGEITLQEVEKSIKELPLPEKVKTIAIYKRYKQIRKIEEEMQAAIREVEKKYLKLDEPVLNSVHHPLCRFRTLLEESAPSPLRN